MKNLNTLMRLPRYILVTEVTYEVKFFRKYKFHDQNSFIVFRFLA